MGLQSLKSFYKFFAPILLFLLGTSITAYVERIFLAQFSENALAGSLNGFFLARIFQFSSLAVIVGGQTFVGLFHGSNQPKQIGSCVWQLIWFSLATILFVPPLGFALEHLYYHNTILAQSEGSYFSLLCWFNFLFPLAGAFSAFYIGRGQTLVIVILTLASCVLNIGLDYLLIFGNAWVAPMGPLGASLGKVVSQGFLCLVLAFLFLRSKNHAVFGTRNWAFQPLLFWHYIKPGFYRALGAIFCFADWSFISRTMSVMTETHLLVFSMGATIFYFFTFYNDALLQTMVTIAATNIGKKQNHEIWKTVFNGLFMLAIYALLLCIPFFIFPDTLTFCFKATAFEHEMLSVMQTITPSIWCALVAHGVSIIALSLLIASRDTLFLCRYYTLFWIISSVPLYILMTKLGFDPLKFWYMVFITNTLTAIIYFKRASRQRWLREEWQPKLVM